MLRVTIGPPNDFDRLQTAIDSSPEIERLVFTSVYPGGWDTCSVSWKKEQRPHVSSLPQPVEAMGFEHVAVLDGTDVVWEGRLMRPAIVNGRLSAMEAQGYLYALEDNYFNSRSQTRISGLALAREAVRQSTSIVQMGAGAQAGNPGGGYVPAEHDGMTGKAILDQLSSDGDGRSEWGYTVYNRLVTFTARVAPSPAEYVIAADDDVIVMLDATNTYGAAAATFADANTQIAKTRMLKSLDFQNRYGFQRTALVNGGERGSSSALRAVKTWLAVHAQPVVSASVLRAGRGLEHAGGGITPGWQVQAGQGASLEGYSDLLVVRTSYDAVVDQLSADLGRPAPTTYNASREARRVINAIKGNVNPSELGGPLRRLQR